MTALKRELVDEAEIESAVVAATRLNRGARDAMQAVGPSAATDVTGFGLLGHAGEMLLGAGLGARFSLGAVPVWEGAAELAAGGCYAAGLAANRAHREADVVADGVYDAAILPLYDPQTSGGLLIAVASEKVDRLVVELEQRGETAAVVGEVTSEPVLRVVA